MNFRQHGLRFGQGQVAHFAHRSAAQLCAFSVVQPHRHPTNASAILTITTIIINIITIAIIIIIIVIMVITITTTITDTTTATIITIIIITTMITITVTITIIISPPTDRHERLFLWQWASSPLTHIGPE